MLYNCGPVNLHSPEVDICFGHMMLVSEDEDSWRAPLIAVSNPPTPLPNDRGGQHGQPRTT